MPIPGCNAEKRSPERVSVPPGVRSRPRQNLPAGCKQSPDFLSVNHPRDAIAPPSEIAELPLPHLPSAPAPAQDRCIPPHPADSASPPAQTPPRLPRRPLRAGWQSPTPPALQTSPASAPRSPSIAPRLRKISPVRSKSWLNSSAQPHPADSASPLGRVRRPLPPGVAVANESRPDGNEPTPAPAATGWLL